jgi:hypothetical protein
LFKDCFDAPETAAAKRGNFQFSSRWFRLAHQFAARKGKSGKDRGCQPKLPGPKSVLVHGKFPWMKGAPRKAEF